MFFLWITMLKTLLISLFMYCELCTFPTRLNRDY